MTKTTLIRGSLLGLSHGFGAILRLRSALLLALLCLSLYPLTLSAQLSKEELKRMQRLRPSYPFDRSGDYRILDAWAIKAAQDTTATKPPKWWQDAILGKVIDLSRGWSLGFDGLVNLYLGKEPYEGHLLGYEVYAMKELGLGSKLIFRSQHTIGLKSRRYLTNQRLLYFYASQKGGLAILDAGRTIDNTAHIANDEAFAEHFLTPLGTNGSPTDYLKDYISLRNSLYISPKFSTDILALYEDRRPQDIALGMSHRLLMGEVRLSYDFATRDTPDATFPTAEQLPRGRFAPELSLAYRVAIDPTAGGSSIAYTKSQTLSLGIRSSYAFDDYRRLSWAIVGEHIIKPGLSTQDALVLPHGSALGRDLIDNTWSTGRHLRLQEGSWIWGRVNYGGGRLALAHIALLKRWGIDEQLHLRALLERGGRTWLEAGYSLGLGRMARVGLFYGTDYQDSHEFRARLSLPLLYLTGRVSNRY